MTEEFTDVVYGLISALGYCLPRLHKHLATGEEISRANNALAAGRELMVEYESTNQ